MNVKNSGKKLDLQEINITKTASLIVDCQKKNGDIPWCKDEKTDAWDLVESTMGLNIGGFYKESRLAFDFLIEIQNKDGSFYASYMNGKPLDKTLDTNMSSYIAVGAYHYYLVTEDKIFLKKLWYTLKKSIDFALNLQAPGGEIYWAKSPMGNIDRMALLTGSSSVFMSLKCALAISKELGYKMKEWENALFKIQDAIRNRPFSFNITKSRYSMDWFYPVLSGAITGKFAQNRIDKYWKKFIIDGIGVRCVSDEPWITIAETSELVIALSAMGNKKLAEIVFNWVLDRIYDDGSYWCGFTYPNMVIWPEEKLTWTNAAILIAADSLFNLTPAGKIFDHQFWNLPNI